MEELLQLAIDDPERGRRQAEDLLTSSADPAVLSYAHQCLGIVARDAGQAELADTHLRAGLRAAQLARDADRERDVRASYGTALACAGRSRQGLVQLQRAMAGASGHVAPRIAVRMAGVLATTGRFADSAAVLRDAAASFSALDDSVWEARARIWLAHTLLHLGQLDDAQEEAESAGRLYDGPETVWERISVLENLADIAAARGDLVRSLRLGAEAARFCAELGVEPRAELVGQNASVHLAAGLADDAAAVLGQRLATTSLTEMDRAELQLLRADALLAAGRPPDAIEEARAARRGFEHAGRTWYARRAQATLLQARVRAGEVRGAAAEARGVAEALDTEGAPEAPLALTLAGRLARGADRIDLWTRAASYRHHPNALVRAAAWHAQGLAREETHDRGGVLRAAAAGLDAIDEHRRLIGSSELRALATTHGRELTTIALRHAASDARTLLRWSERTRATALAQPPATSDAATIPASLAALRDNGRQLAEARQEGTPTEELERERRRLERAVRAESHTLSATTATQQRPTSVEEIVAATGETCLVELVDVDGSLHVVVAHAGKVRRRVAGTTSEIAALLGPAGMLLRRAARGRPADTATIGRSLQQAVLGDAVRLLPDAPVTLAPTARLHGLAWSLLPALQDRPFAVVPSAGQWLRARATPAPQQAGTVLVAGPALASGGAEVPVLAERHPDAVLLDGPRATLEAVLAHLDGAGLVHLAAHGRFRADSPLFSALDLADGPLTVHDLERVPRAPYRVVLSACESGVLAPVGAEELLGLAAALFSLGTAGLVCSVGEVNDDATADLMVGLHAALADGSDPATALCEVRRRAAGDPVAAGTAAAFLALGV
ncbi:CHAT domain-containing protein [Nocardioides sp. QY071]|uniref:CHAT domain-containing protein n=1 Tax=Nocardioides sp. QY071 TaxID=3044187 RepID=UPI00249AC8F7|nr:CHAT domain-containing protein [Nocardioides sp. QY071]WGY02334.1 CHAT domain-containing protein [Nocardioides sp. QY071]